MFIFKIVNFSFGFSTHTVVKLYKVFTRLARGLNGLRYNCVCGGAAGLRSYCVSEFDTWDEGRGGGGERRQVGSRHGPHTGGLLQATSGGT